MALLSLGALAEAGEELLFHAEAQASNETLWSSGEDVLFNPASVIKVATTVLAIDRLGPQNRYVTRFGCQGSCEIESGVMRGDLVVGGGGDPDFHPENAWLIARELNRLGIGAFSGELVVANPFWMGWDHGVEGWENDPGKRARVMGGRLRRALAPDLWTEDLKASWGEAAGRNGWPDGDPPSVTIAGATQVLRGTGTTDLPLVKHRSNPLIVTLKRLNTYSNNDIIRIAELNGGVAAVESYLRTLSTGLKGEIEVATASGERKNRMTARQVVRLMWALRDLGIRLQFEPEDVLPVPGCDPGPTPRMFPRLASGPSQSTAVIKTGTLSTTDGGVAVLAGYFDSRDKGPVAFCVAAPRAGRALRTWRLAEQEWLLDLMGQLGGAVAVECGPEIAYPETFAEIEIECKAAGDDAENGPGNPGQ